MSRLYKFPRVGLHAHLFLWLLPAREFPTESLLGIYHVRGKKAQWGPSGAKDVGRTSLDTSSACSEIKSLNKEALWPFRAGLREDTRLW